MRLLNYLKKSLYTFKAPAYPKHFYQFLNTLFLHSNGTEISQYDRHGLKLNHDDFIYDTLDLSVIRGGSLLLLNVNEIVDTEIKKNALEVEMVNAGASIAIFSFIPQTKSADLGQHRRQAAWLQEC